MLYELGYLPSNPELNIISTFCPEYEALNFKVNNLIILRLNIAYGASEWE